MNVNIKKGYECKISYQNSKKRFIQWKSIQNKNC